MLNSFVLMIGFIPLLTGLGLIFRPKQVAKAQVKFRKRMEKFEKRFFKAHRSAGLGFILGSLVFLMSYFHPVWIFNSFLVVRLVSGLFFPQLYQHTNAVKIVPTMWI